MSQLPVAFEWLDANRLHRLWVWLHTSSPADWMLVVVGLGAAIAAICTLRAINREVAATELAARAAADAVIEARKAAAISDRSATAAADTLDTNREIERAYISITHENAKIHYERLAGGGPNLSQPVSITFKVLVRNSGRTPGNLLGGHVGFLISAKPGPPQVSQTISPLTAAFMLPDGHVEFEASINVSNTPALHDVLEGTGDQRLWLVGEADYADRFDRMHIGGYGRCLFVQPGRYVGLSHVPETGPYNYDRPMTPNEVKRYAKP